MPTPNSTTIRNTIETILGAVSSIAVVFKEKYDRIPDETLPAANIIGSSWDQEPQSQGGGFIRQEVFTLEVIAKPTTSNGVDTILDGIRADVQAALLASSELSDLGFNYITSTEREGIADGQDVLVRDTYNINFLQSNL